MRGFWSLPLVLAFCLNSHGAVTLQFIDRGEPTDGVQTLHGWHGIVIRAVSDSGPITRVNAGSQPRAGGILGAAMLQRWIDPTGNGLYAYPDPRFSQRSPLGLADNTRPTVENFDSHLLGDPANMQIESPFGERNNSIDHFYLRTNLVSTGSVGYGASWPQPVFDADAGYELGKIWGIYDVLPAYQSQTLDLAYIVSDSKISYGFTVYASGEPFGVIGVYLVPESATLALMLFGCFTLSRRKRNIQRVRPCRAESTIDALDLRLCFSLSTPGTLPLALQASPILSGGVQIQWEPINPPDATDTIDIFWKLPDDNGWTSLAANLAPMAGHYDDTSAEQ